jgi:hypothetical protein
MKRFHTLLALASATVFGAVAMAAQILLLRRFLWQFEAAEMGVALFLSCWLLWTGLGAATAATPPGRRLAGLLARALWLPVAAGVALYFAQYALLGNLRGWLGVPGYERFPLLQLALGCLLANAPFCFAAGFVVPAVCRRLSELGEPVSRAFAWEALGAAVGGLGVTLLLVRGLAPDPRDEAEWARYFPQATERPGRFETGGGTTFYGTHGGTFYALSSGGVSEVLPEGDRSMEVAALLLSQRPYAREALLLGRVPLAVGVSLAALRPDLAVTWCPCDAAYGVRILEAARACGLAPTNVCAAGATPQAVLAAWPAGACDAAVVMPPPATALEGAAWRQEAFARSVRRVTRRTGVALFGLDCETAALTPEKEALLGAAVRSVRRAWPESGVFAAGAGGWWVAAQVPRLAYGATNAVARFARLKREDAFPAEAVARLYDEARAARWAQACPALNPAEPVLMPEEEGGVEKTLAAGLCDAIRQAAPSTAPAVWVARLKAADGVRLIGLMLVALWMAPVALGTARNARRRLLAAWVAACGALGLAALLSVLYRLQVGFGSLYLLAGAGSCLYLSGLFCGNRVAEAVATRLLGRERSLLGAAVVCTLALAGVALAVAPAAEQAATAVGLVSLCFAVGCAAGATLPVALALCGEGAAEGAAVFVCADAAGAALAGVAFAALVPLAGLWQAVGCFAALACGVALCAAGANAHPRLASGLALVVALAVVGGRVNALREPAVDAAYRAPDAAAGRRVVAEPHGGLAGIPRRLDVPRVREQMQRGLLATNAAAFWE